MNHISDSQLEQILARRAEGMPEAEVLRQFPLSQQNEIKDYLLLLEALDTEKRSLDPGEKEKVRMWSRLVSVAETFDNDRQASLGNMVSRRRRLGSGWREWGIIGRSWWIPAMAGVLVVLFWGVRWFGKDAAEVATEYRSPSASEMTVATTPEEANADDFDRVIETLVFESENEGVLLADEDLDTEISFESETILKAFDETYDETLL